MDRKLATKLTQVRTILQELNRVLIAFSGGVDSTLLLAVAAQTLGAGNVVAVTGRSAIRPARDCEQAVELAASLGAQHIVIHTDELMDDAFVGNPPDRCYYCKQRLLTKLQHLAEKKGISSVIEGSNKDDLSAYRPGSRAVREMGVRSPLLEANLSKEDIRCISRELGLPTWDKPAQPCLATRFPYGEPLSPDRLKMVESGEAFLFDRGFRYIRLRCHGGLARIETAPGEIERLINPGVRHEIIKRLKELGFAYVTVDLQGYRSGSMDEGLEHAENV